MWGSTTKSCPQNWSSQCKEIKEWMFILCLLHVRSIYPFKILPYKGTFSDTELRSQGGYLLVHDQIVINYRSAPSHLGNSWDANVPSASAMLMNKSGGGKLTLKRQESLKQWGRNSLGGWSNEWVWELTLDGWFVFIVTHWGIWEMIQAGWFNYMFETWIPSLRPTKLSSFWINTSASGFCITWHHICHFLCCSSPPLSSDPLPLSHPLLQQTTW